MSNPSPTATMTSTQTSGKMRSTWWLKDQSEWTLAMKIINRVDPHDVDPPERHYGKIPTLSSWETFASFAPRTLIWVAGQWAIHRFIGPLPVWAALLYWAVAYNVVVGFAAKLFIDLGHKWGYFDGAKPRDKAPDYKLTFLAFGMVWSSIIRVVLGTWYLYDPAAPVSVSPFLPLKLFVFAIVLDFFFYAYHRSCHEVDFLWRFHKTHHLTKHPTASLALLADQEQEIIEVVIVPTLTTLLCKHVLFPSFTFQEWAVIITFINIAEVVGHTGVRARLTGFNTAWLLNLVLPRAVLTLEDHDLHHREGWKKSSNYGKQSLFWDWAFGSLRDRPEGYDANVDWSLSVFDEVPAGHTTAPAAS